MNLLRHITWEQPDYMWQYQLKYERDVIAQSEVGILGSVVVKDGSLYELVETYYLGTARLHVAVSA